MAHPDWAVKFRRPGTELRRRTDKLYCLYECSSVYDKQKKRARKVTGRYLGSITEGGGFRPSKKRLLEQELEQARRSGRDGACAKVGAVKEYGFSRYILDCQSECVGVLKRLFPREWQRIVALVYCRLRHQSPLRYVQGDFADSHLSVEIGARGLSPNALSGFMRDLGKERPSMLAYMRSCIGGGEHLIFDGSDILSASRLMDFPRMSKTKIGTFDNVANMMWVFNSTRHMPVYYRLMPGNIKDVSSFRLCLEEAGLKDGVAVIDKGFQSKENIELLDKAGVKFILSLRRSTRVEDPKQEDHTMDGYRDKSLRFGTLALMSTSGKDARGAYIDYRTRTDVEQAIDVFKNCLEADSSYMQDEKALEAWMFINLIAMQWYYELRGRMVESKLIARFSPMQMVRVLGRARVVNVNGRWTPAELSKKERKLFDTLGVHITQN